MNKIISQAKSSITQGALHIEEATIVGRLYELPSGIPVLQVPDSNILAVGSSNPMEDVATQEQFLDKLAIAECEADDWQIIQGELIVFPDATTALPPIDHLEGFNPGSHSMYNRVLLPVLINGKQQVSAWCYAGDSRLLRIAMPTGKTSWP